MSYNKKDYEKKIFGINETNRISVEMAKDVITKLKDKVGLKIYNVDFSLSKKHQIEIKRVEPKYFGDEYLKLGYTYLKISEHSIWLHVQVAIKKDQHSCYYEHKQIWLGKNENLHLIELETFENIDFYHNKQYDVNEQIALLEKSKELKKELETIKRNLVIE